MVSVKGVPGIRERFSFCKMGGPNCYPGYLIPEAYLIYAYLLTDMTGTRVPGYRYYPGTRVPEQVEGLGITARAYPVPVSGRYLQQGNKVLHRNLARYAYLPRVQLYPIGILPGYAYAHGAYPTCIRTSMYVCIYVHLCTYRYACPNSCAYPGTRYRVPVYPGVQFEPFTICTRY